MLFFFARRRSYIGNEPVEKKIVFQCLTNLQRTRSSQLQPQSRATCSRQHCDLRVALTISNRQFWPSASSQ